jgi:probable O-glycosylation ligase (exosortase A-associated)
MGIRALLLQLMLVAVVPLALYAPYVGIYAYYWISFGGPESQVFGAPQVDWGKVVAIAALLSWLFSRNSKALPMSAVTVLVVLFYLWTGLTTLTARVPVPAQEHFFLWSKIFLMFIVTLAVINTRERLHGLIWIVVISIGYHGLKGGVFTLVAGGNWNVLGPVGTALKGTNEFARALMMTIPLIFYLSFYAQLKWIRLGLLALVPICVLAMIGTNSRSTLLAFSFACLVLWLYSRRKMLYLVLTSLLVAGAFLILPAARWEGLVARFSSIEEYEQDSSLLSRYDIWDCIVNQTANSPIVGGGFTLSENICRRAPHSSYFEVLGEHGYVGLALYLMLGLAALGMAMRLTVLGRTAPKHYWARDFGVMMQCVIVSYFAGGFTKNHGFFELYYVEVAMLVAAMSILRKDIRAGAPQRSWMHPAAIAARDPTTSPMHPRVPGGSGSAAGD